jgi:hypothetical protein
MMLSEIICPTDKLPCSKQQPLCAEYSYSLYGTLPLKECERYKTRGNFLKILEQVVEKITKGES